MHVVCSARQGEGRTTDAWRSRKIHCIYISVHNVCPIKSVWWLSKDKLACPLGWCLILYQLNSGRDIRCRYVFLNGYFSLTFPFLEKINPLSFCVNKIAFVKDPEWYTLKFSNLCTSGAIKVTFSSNQCFTDCLFTVEREHIFENGYMCIKENYFFCWNRQNKFFHYLERVSSR